MSESRQLILGVDFDNTIFINSFPHNYLEPNWPIIDHIKRRRSEGWYIILITCRTSPDLVNGAIDAAYSVGIEFDAINSNHPDMIKEWGECRKIFCDEYIDDKNISLAELSMGKTASNTSQNQIVYIAGKMRGLPDYGKSRFNQAESLLRSKGYIALNPAILPNDMPQEKYMPICLSMLEAADSIYMLDNWQDSKGACAEYHYAVCQGKHIIFESEESTERI